MSQPLTTPAAHTPAAHTTAASTTATSGGRAGTIALWVLQVLTAGIFVMAAVPKVTADPMAAAGFAQIGLGNAGMYIIGTLELLGAIALFVPRLMGLAATAFVALMIGAVIVTLAVDGPAMVALPAGTLVASAIIAWARRRETARLVARLRPGS